MYAIVDIAGQQFKVEKDQKIFVHRLESEVGDQVDFDKVLLIDNENIVVVGEPVIEGAMITAKVLEHLKGDKVIVFKKKRRKGYKVKNGHRQFFTQLLIEEIVEKGGKARPVVKEKKAKQPVAEKPVTEKAVTEKPAEVSPETVDVKPEVTKSEVIKEKPVTSEAPAKKATAKKPVTKETKAKKATESAAEKKAEVKPKAKVAPKKAAAKTTAAKKDDKPAAAKKTKKATDKDK